MVGDEPEDPFDRGDRQRAVTVRAGHQADEDGTVVDDERRHPEDVEPAHHVLVLGPDLLGRPTGVDLGQHGVGVDSGPGQGLADHVAITEVTAVVVAGGEERPVDGQEVLGEPVPDDDAGGQGQKIGLLGRVVPG